MKFAQVNDSRFFFENFISMWELRLDICTSKYMYIYAYKEAEHKYFERTMAASLIGTHAAFNPKLAANKHFDLAAN